MAATQVLGQNAAASLTGALAQAGNQSTIGGTVTLLGSDGAKLEIQKNGVMIAKSSGGRKITIATAKANASTGTQGVASKAAAGKAAVGKATLGASAMDKATMAKKITLMGDNGARLEIKRNGLMLAKSAKGREIKIASAKTHPTVMGLGKASAGQGAGAAKVTIVGTNGASLQIPASGPLVAKGAAGGKICVEAATMKAKAAGAAKLAKGAKIKIGAAKMGSMGAGKGAMTKGAMLKAAAAQAALNPGREANVVAANGAKLELKRNGMIQMKTAGGKEVKIAANAKGKLAMLGGAGQGQGAVKTVAATKTVAPAVATSAAPPMPLLAPKHAIIAHKGGLVLVNPQFFVPAASKTAAAATGAIAAKTAAATGAAATTTGLGIGLGLGALGPALLVGAAAVTGFGIYGYVTRGRGD